MLENLGQRQARGFLAHPLDQPDELRQHRAGLAREVGHRGVETGIPGARGVLQLLERASADAAGGKIHHPHEGGIVVRVGNEAQIGQRMLDLLALEKAQPAIHPIGDAG